MSVRTLPMFPLGTVLFPHVVLPLHVFEPRYRALTRDVLARDQEFGVVLIERGSEVGGGDVRFDVGTVAHVVQASELPDGRYALAVVGVQRFRVVQWLPDDPYPRAEIVEVTDSVGGGDAHEFQPVVTALRELWPLQQRAQGLPAHTPIPRVELSPDAEQASFEIAALAPLGPLDAQRVLELTNTNERFRLLHETVLEYTMLLRAQLGDEGEP
jgi:uncharacterized protein